MNIKFNKAKAQARLANLDSSYFVDGEDSYRNVENYKQYLHSLATWIFDCGGLDAAFHDNLKEWLRFKKIIPEWEEVLDTYFNRGHDT